MRKENNMLEKQIEWYSSAKQCDRKKEAENICLKQLQGQNVSIVKSGRKNNLVFIAIRLENTKETICKIVNTRTNLRYNNILRYEIFDEQDCPNDYRICPSAILKTLTDTNDKERIKFRQDCKDILDMLAIEKKCEISLTNLPVGTKIKLNKQKDGKPIVLIKEDLLSKYPIWIVDDSVDIEKYKIKDIQEIGYEIC